MILETAQETEKKSSLNLKNEIILYDVCILHAHQVDHQHYEPYMNHIGEKKDDSSQHVHMHIAYKPESRKHL